ncbi:uncharacterized protein LOC143292073 [Babylonia areolata]|uniref:uncharacterized protein LOC143292073 n=1 Tax=Babylonia areolata TaxID=304850 RepID=UPI003FD40576
MLSLCACLLGLCLLTVLPATRAADRFLVSHDYTEVKYIFLEFRTAEPAENIKQYFENVTVKYSFKVYGAGHYIFVIHDDNNQNLRKLALPADASTTVSTFPVETVQTFMHRFDIDVRINQTRVPDEGLIFVEVIRDISGVTEKQYRAMLAEHVRDVTPEMINPPGIAVFVAVSSLPVKYVHFRKRDSRDTHIFVEYSDAYGGPGTVKSRTLRIHNL